MTTMKEIFTTLQVGDLLTIPIKNPSDPSKEPLISSVVLLRKEGSKLFLSTTNKGVPIPTPSFHGPFEWKKDIEVVTDAEGEIPYWYSVNITCERGAGAKIVEKYRRIPREKDAPVRITDQNLKSLQKSIEDSGTLEILQGIMNNGEAGDVRTQLSLILEALKVDCTPEQYLGLSVFVTALELKHKMALDLVSTEVTVIAVELPPG